MRRAAKSPLPMNFDVSDSVRQWAIERGYAGHLAQHLDAFVGYVTAHGKEYVDWDAALKNAIRSDWGGVRKASAGPSAEMALDRSMRARMQEAVPDVAARCRPAPESYEVIEMEVPSDDR